MEQFKQNTGKLTVVILAAGFGRRMGPFSRMINKSLIPYNNKALISYIMDKFPDDTNFIIACGHNAEQVKIYVSNVHYDKNVKFVDIPNYDEVNTGPATTLRRCAPYIDSSFFWISCDTLFEFDYSDKLTENWIAVHPVNSNVAQDYCWVERDGDKLVSVHNKEKSDSAVDAFIGLMYLTDKKFIDALDKKDSKEMYEGFNSIDLKAYTVSEWKDFGTYEKWKTLSEGIAEVSFPKPDELFYSDNGKIIKFTTDGDHAYRRFLRGMINSECMPENMYYEGNFFMYDRVAGDTLYTNLNSESFKLFLNWAQEKVWTDIIDKPRVVNTQKLAYRFYKEKTDDRLKLFRTKYSDWEEPQYVNDTPVLSIPEYLSRINFDRLSKEIQWKFIHGDLQFDNIIFNTATKEFTAIDWRTDFAGDYYGDIYYDLAKMLGGLYLSYKYVKEGKLKYSEVGNKAQISLVPVDGVEEYVKLLEQFTKTKGLSWRKVQELVPIIYLNMAPLHDAPLDKYLIALAQLYFSKL